MYCLLLSSKVYGLQYVELTIDKFRLRLNKYKCSQRVTSEDGTPKQNYFDQHFFTGYLKVAK